VRGGADTPVVRGRATSLDGGVPPARFFELATAHA
jgi:hypothetical protein